MTKTINKHYYIKYIPKCPKCGLRGSLRMLIVQQGKKKFGPYFTIQHMKKVYSRKKYRELLTKGLSPEETHKHNRFISKRRYDCYFGKHFPWR